MKNKIIELLNEKKWTGAKLAKHLGITPQTLREEITNIRRNWSGYGFLIADNNGYWISYDVGKIEKYEIKVYSRYLGIQKELDNIIRTKWKTETKRLDIIEKLKKDYLLEEEIIKLDEENIWDKIDLVKEYEKLFKKYNVGAIRHRVEEYTLSDIKKLLLIEAGWD